MRVLPYFVGAATLVAIGGAAMGGAIDTTPRQIFDSSATIPAGSGITYDNDRREMPTANHYPLEAGDKRYEVAELRERARDVHRMQERTWGDQSGARAARVCF